MKLPAVSSWLAQQAAPVRTRVLASAQRLGGSLEIIRARVMVAILWSEFHAMKLAAMPIQM
jgi:transposase